MDNNQAKRENLFIATKAGFIPSDTSKSASPRRIAAEWAATYGAEFPSEEIVEGKHCIAPACLEMSIKASTENLGVKTIDLLYLHNVAEKQLPSMSLGEVMGRLKKAFKYLEKRRADGAIRFYGLATWSCFRVDVMDSLYMSLTDVVKLAEEVGGADHGFRFIQVPVTATMPEAALETFQDGATLVEKAKELGVTVMSSRSVGAGKFDVMAVVETAYATCVKNVSAADSAAVDTSSLSQVLPSRFTRISHARNKRSSPSPTGTHELFLTFVSFPHYSLIHPFTHSFTHSFTYSPTHCS